MGPRPAPARLAYASRAHSVFVLALLGSAVAVPSGAAAVGWPGVERSLAQEFERPAPARPAPARRVELLGQIAATPGAGAEQVLLRALSDEEVSVRLAAAGYAGRRRFVGAAPVLATWLDEPQPEVRAQAARVLGVLGQRAMLPALVRLLGDSDVEVRLAAVDALARMGGADATVPLLDRLSDPETRVRIATVQALGQAGDARAVLSLLGTLQDSLPEVRKEVASALGRLRDPRGLRGLLGLLRDPQLEVRLAAVHALGTLGVADAAVDLLPLALRDESAGAGDPTSRTALARAAIEAIGRIGGPDAREVLARVFRRSEGALDVAGAAADQLRALGPGDGAVVTRLATSPVPSPLVPQLIQLLGDLGGDASAEALVAMYDSPDGRAARDASSLLQTLGRTGSPRALRLLLRALPRNPRAPQRDEDARRGAALAGLEAFARARGRIDPEAFDPLEALLAPGATEGSTPDAARAYTATVLGLLGATENPRASRVVGPYLQSPHHPLRVAAARALARLGVASVEGPAARGLGDPDPAVRLALADGITRTGGSAVVEALIAVWVSSQPVDRASAARALGRSAARVPALRDRAALLLASSLRDASATTGAAYLDALASLTAAGSVVAAHELTLALGSVALAGPAAEGFANAAAMGERLDGATRARVTEALRAATSTGQVPAARAAAAWGLGRLGAESWPVLRALLADADTSVTVNALGALAANAASFRDAIASGDPDGSARRALLCPLVERRSPAVRANALLAAARLGASCDAVQLRAVLTDGRAPFVRFAAAEALSASVRAAALPAAQPRPAAAPPPAAGTTSGVATPARDGLLNAAVLERCAASDAVSWVAQRCRRAATADAAATSDQAGAQPSTIDAMLMREEDDAGVSRAAYWLVRSDGVVRAGETGPDGWIHERPAPAGVFRVYEPGSFASEP